MQNKMIIDATHDEEVRVAVVHGSRVEEFDFETVAKKQIRGNIYLATVTRVEPSLQAAFVDYGGNRHGFLAFSEIHPDYYQIPLADREALIAEEKEQEEKDAALDDVDDDLSEASEEKDDRSKEGSSEEEEGEARGVEDVSNGDDIEEVSKRRKPLHRRYKIQDVIKRRQVILVQIVKEERGNKGAALTTYLSMAGRYAVLMPNTPRGGGISRKITNGADRKRLKKIASELSVPEGMGVILRTAGAHRTKAEIKRDFDYLMRLWDGVRKITLESIAPVLVHEEGSLIRRSIRDLYNKTIEIVLVAGDAGYKEAKSFMKTLMPSHAKNVKLYKDEQPIFIQHGVESQLDEMFSPEVILTSGGYIVLNQTEALVSIDVNSGKATREHNIEDTAYKTNLEAAEEIARQLRLRDLAGLVVIDFIDMDDKRHGRAVERRLKECLKADRARIQVGHISSFGLLEMSRQRIRASVLESTVETCPHCAGTGYVRAASSIALSVIRNIEDILAYKEKADLTIKIRSDVALYLLNEKRASIIDLENRYQVSILVHIDNALEGDHYIIEKSDDGTKLYAPVKLSAGKANASYPSHNEDQSSRKKRRRRKDQKSQDENGQDKKSEQHVGTNDEVVSDDEDQPKRRKRGRRGGRRRKSSQNEAQLQESQEDSVEKDVSVKQDAKIKDDVQAQKEPDQQKESDPLISVADDEKPKRKRNRPRRKVKSVDVHQDEVKEAKHKDKKPARQKQKKTDGVEESENKAATESSKPARKRISRPVRKVPQLGAVEEKQEIEKAPGKSRKVKKVPHSLKEDVEDNKKELKSKAKGWWQSAISSLKD